MVARSTIYPKDKHTIKVISRTAKTAMITGNDNKPQRVKIYVNQFGDEFIMIDRYNPLAPIFWA